MKVLLSGPLNTQTGYGTDLVELSRALLRWGVDLYIHPSGVHPPLPRDVLAVLSKPIPSHVDLLISHRCPQELAFSPESAGLYATATISAAWTMWEWCVDASTEIFTKRGWLTYSQLRLGEDETLGIDPDTGLSYWQVVEDMYVGEVKSRQMLKLDFSDHSSLTTKHHKWLVRSNGRWAWQTSEELTSVSAIPRNAVRGDLPEELKYTDAFVEMVAWAYTEGQLDRDSSIYIGQSHTHRPTHVARIRGALTSLFGPAAVVCRSDGGVSWSECVRSDGIVVFSLSQQASAVVLAAAPDNFPSREFLLSLTRSQLELFLDVSVLGDVGLTRHDTCGMSHQNTGPFLETFLFACTLAGRTVSRGYFVSSSRGQQVAEVVDHFGMVWCPTTKYQNWLARRDGAVYFTGNSSLANVDEVNQANCEHAFRVSDNLERALTAFDVVFAYDEVSQEALSPYHPRVDILQGGIEPLSFLRRDWTSNPFRFLMVGALSSRKNPFASINAFKKLRDAGELQNAQLVLKSSLLTLHPAMEKWCPGLRIICETWSVPEIHALYAQSHVLLAPSWGEGKNRPALEFATSGGAVVATCVGGHAQWMSSDYSWSVDYSRRATSPGAFAAIADEDHLAELMLQLYTDRAETARRAEIAARVLPAMVSWDRVLDRFCARLEGVSGRRGVEVSALMRACRQSDDGETNATRLVRSLGSLDEVVT